MSKYYIKLKKSLDTIYGTLNLKFYVQRSFMKIWIFDPPFLSFANTIDQRSVEENTKEFSENSKKLSLKLLEKIFVIFLEKSAII